MKLLQFPANGLHKKNFESMCRMCAVHGIQYEQTNDRNRLNIKDYDILWLPNNWISPDEFPGQKILYGPHHFVFPNGAICGQRNIEWSNRCIYTTLSYWNQEVHTDFVPQSVIPFTQLPFGVRLLEQRNLNTVEWDCLLYCKHRSPEDIAFAETIVKKAGLKYKVFRYGSYHDGEYQEALMKTKFVVWVGSHESQGFAFQECLSHNVPILVFDATSMFAEFNNGFVYKSFEGKKKLLSTTASYWDPCCGELVKSKDELEASLATIQAKLSSYTPRHFIQEMLNDKLCMQRILTALNITI